MSQVKPSAIVQMFGVQYPIVQGGMVWVSGAKLAAAVSNAGALGLIGAGSMKPDLLRQQIIKAKTLTNKPFGINLPLLYDGAKDQIDVALELGVKIFFTSAGSPKKFTPYLKEKGCTVVHVTSTPDLAKKCEDAGVDAVVAEGFEAGGHNGRDEITTLVLIPQVVKAVRIPVIAAGGIGTGSAIAAMLALGAAGVQIGSRFAATVESSAHDNFKNAIVKSSHDATVLTMKKLVPVRLLKNKFCADVMALEDRAANKEELASLLGKGRAKRGMLEGDMDEGELEIGQVSALIKDVPTCQDLVRRLVEEYRAAAQSLPASL